MRNLLPTLLGAMALIACGRDARAVTPSPDEMAESRRWASAHLEAAAPDAPFSFVYDGRTSSEFRKSIIKPGTPNKNQPL